MFCSVAGAQWNSPVVGQVSHEGSSEKPEFEFNKIHLRMTKLKEQYRQNTIEAKFTPANETAEMSTELAMDLYRADKHNSKASLAFLTAFEEAATGGFGAWRLCTSYENEESEEDDYQRVRYEPIYDADVRVFFDPDSKCQDKSDAKYCFVINTMRQKDFNREYGEDASPWSNFNTLNNAVGNYFNWVAGDTVYVLEYYIVEEKTDKLVFFEGLTEEKEKHYQSELKENPQIEIDLEDRGFKRIGIKRVKKKEVHKYVLGADTVLDDEGVIPCKMLPIIPVYGNYLVIEGVEYFYGEVRQAKDAQRMSNSLRSKLAEISMMSSVEVPIFLREQVAGCEEFWKDKDRDLLSFVVVNGLENPDGSTNPLGPVGYTKTPAIPPALAALLEFTNRDMQELLGTEDNQINLSNVSNDTFMGAQDRIDARAYVYISNMAIAMEQDAKVWLSFGKRIYVDKERNVKVMNKEGQRRQESLITDGQYDDDRSIMYKNDISSSEFDVDIEIGPTSQSKRKSIVKSIMEMMSVTSDEGYRSILLAMALMNMEGEGLSDIRRFFRKELVGKGIIPPTPEEQKEIQEAQQEAQNAPPGPEEELMAAMTASEFSKAQEKEADRAKKEAETLKIYSEIEREDVRVASAMMDSMEAQNLQKQQMEAQLAQQNVNPQP